VIRLNITNPVKLDQTITFDPLPNKTLGTPTFPVTATASSSLPVSYTVLTLSVCTLSGNMTTLVSAGACAIRAMQSGDATYNPAPSVDQSFQVTVPLMVYLPLMMK
jgi:hypothetical protein